MLSIVGQAGQVFIRGIDAVPRSFWGDFRTKNAYVYIPPGRHNLKLQYIHGTPIIGQEYTDEVDSQHELLAGHTYAVHFELLSTEKKGSIPAGRLWPFISKEVHHLWYS
jgi:hypothetical protein